MGHRVVRSPVIAALVVAGLLAGCGDDQDPAGAATFWNRIHDENYRGWSRAPGYPGRRNSDAPHGDQVEIYVNGTVSAALAAGRPLTTWPVGSVIVKDGWDSDGLKYVAAMERRSTGWFWAEWRPSGSAIFSGAPTLCTDCHASGSDGVRAFGLP
jgi:hypothetical protein